MDDEDLDPRMCAQLCQPAERARGPQPAPADVLPLGTPCRRYRENRLKEAAQLAKEGIEPMPHKFAPALGPSWMQVRHFREKYDDPAVTKPGERLSGAHLPSSLY